MKAHIVAESRAHGSEPVNQYSGLSREALIEILRRRDAQAHYGLVWERKDISPDQALNHDFVGLELDEEHSCGKAPWRNLIIEGDNYDALRTLVTHYAGQIKPIYIDPPYNTGRRDFVYNDRFVDSTDRFRHSIWLEFMFQRLRLARDLLSPDGAIFVSVDDHQLFNLGLLMNQVFVGSSAPSSYRPDHDTGGAPKVYFGATSCHSGNPRGSFAMTGPETARSPDRS